MTTTELAFYRNTAEQDLTDTATINQLTKVDDGRLGETETYVFWQTLPCRVTRPINQVKEDATGFSPHTEERWDIAFSAKTIEENNWRILKNWQIVVREIIYQVLDGGEEQTDAFLYHVTTERLY